jgi:hypothetical protein
MPLHARLIVPAERSPVSVMAPTQKGAAAANR